MEPLESYYLRFWKRFRKDATPWARDNIVWGLAVLVIPPLAVYVHDPHAQIDWSVIKTGIGLYIFTAAIYILVHVGRIPKKLDDDRQVIATELAKTIADQKQTIRDVTAKPQRTAAEQHNYDKAKECLEKFGQKAAIALRHLKACGSIIVASPGMGNNIGSFPPPGITPAELNWALGACAGEGVVRCTEPFGKNERVYEIAKNMDKALDELLY
jgi:hypothetical protein